MNSRERYTRAVKFAGPDRVPIMHRTIPGAFRRHGKALEELYARYPSDVLLSPSTRGWFAFKRGVAESSGALRGVTDEWGCVWDSLNPDYLGQVFGHPLDTWEKLPGFKSPEPTVGIEGVQEMVEAVKADGHRHYSLIEVGTLWHLTNWLRGFENSLMDVLEDRPEMYALRDRITDFLLKRVDLLLARREHIDGVLVNDDWGTQETLMIKPAYWRKIYKPAYAKIVEAIHSGGLSAHLHTDGATEAVLEDLIEIGFDEVNPQMSCMDIEDLGRRFGGRVCFRADMDRQYTLPFGTPAEVEAYVQRLYDAFGRSGGGYVGYGQVNTDVPLENAEAMLAAFSRLRYAPSTVNG
ncbi:MAG TPA: uroporphyrinogen decarboxylase family protein [Candidatus Methylomirabilis sp.]|nr:uroporphyrinogen decarboxylase family protein [Candidatus Methylomirabilis sp.]